MSVVMPCSSGNTCASYETPSAFARAASVFRSVIVVRVRSVETVVNRNVFFEFGGDYGYPSIFFVAYQLARRFFFAYREYLLIHFQKTVEHDFRIGVEQIVSRVHQTQLLYRIERCDPK